MFIELRFELNSIPAVFARGLGAGVAMAAVQPYGQRHVGAGRAQLNEEALRKLQTSETSHLAVEALRRLVEQKMREVTRHN